MPGRAPIADATSKGGAAKATFTMQRLWRQAIWGSAAAAALLFAILAGRSDVGAQRAASLLSSWNLASPPALRPGQVGAQAANQAAPRPLDAEAGTRLLAQTVRGLAEDRDRMMTRLATLEHNLDDMTGSISQQIEAAKVASAPASSPWPSDEAPLPLTPATLAAMIAPVAPPPAGLAMPLPPDAAAPASPPAYGADIGRAPSMKALHAQWTALHSAHPELFEGLQPVVTLKDNSRSNRAELRLVVGPFANAERAAQLCAALSSFHLFCQPTMFDRRHLALR